MKTALSIILLFASLGNLLAQTENDIIAITPGNPTTLGIINFEITAGADIPNDDILILSKATTATGVVDADPRVFLGSILSGETATVNIEINSIGTYFVYVKRITTVLQTTSGVQVVVTIPSPPKPDPPSPPKPDTPSPKPDPNASSYMTVSLGVLLFMLLF